MDNSEGLYDLPASVLEQLDAAIEGPYGDGLPIVPPTAEAVRRMCGAVGLPAGHVLGIMPPAMCEVTVGAAAVMAVAAGCKPAYFPVVVAALEALLDPEFNLLAIQATTELAAPLLLVNGPVSRELGIHAGSGCFGPGFRANATIGRAVHLAAMRLGEAIPGETDMATFGHAGKFTACVAEAEAESPWEPLHIERGFAARQSTVTVVGADAPVNVNDFASTSGDGIVQMIANTMSYPGSNNAQQGGEVLVVLSPAHARTLARDGYDKARLRQALFERSAVALERYSDGTVQRLQVKRPRLFTNGPPAAVPVVDTPEAILLAVAGGAGSHSLFFPTYGETTAITRPVRPAG